MIVRHCPHLRSWPSPIVNNFRLYLCDSWQGWLSDIVLSWEADPLLLLIISGCIYVIAGKDDRQMLSSVEKLTLSYFNNFRLYLCDSWEGWSSDVVLSWEANLWYGDMELCQAYTSENVGSCRSHLWRKGMQDHTVTTEISIISSKMGYLLSSGLFHPY